MCLGKLISLIHISNEKWITKQNHSNELMEQKILLILVDAACLACVACACCRANGLTLNKANFTQMFEFRVLKYTEKKSL